MPTTFIRYRQSTAPAASTRQMCDHQMGVCVWCVYISARVSVFMCAHIGTIYVLALMCVIWHKTYQYTHTRRDAGARVRSCTTKRTSLTSSIPVRWLISAYAYAAHMGSHALYSYCMYSIHTFSTQAHTRICICINNEFCVSHTVFVVHICTLLAVGLLTANQLIHTQHTHKSYPSRHRRTESEISIT